MFLAHTTRISADQLIYNNNTHHITYIGNVIATQGNTTLTGNKLIMLLNKQNKIKQLIDYGHPATYRKQTVNIKKRLYAQADIIRYNALKHSILLLGNGRVTQNHAMFLGPHIRYNITTGVVHSTTQGHNQRTVILLQPNKQLKK